MSDPFKLTGPTCLSFSGGRTSAYMLWLVLQSNTAEDIACWLVVCFANTGKEEEATLRFVQACCDHWDIPIVWLEWRDSEQGYAVVDFETAARNSEPFEQMLRKSMLLPNGVTRLCTINLKIRPMARYLRDIGFDGTQDYLENFSWVGFRADEARRVAKLKDKSRAPLAKAGVQASDVGKFWREQPFDLGLPNMNGKTMHGNCDLCFQKPAAQVLSLIFEKPERAVWWARMEKEIPAMGKTTPSGSVFHLSRPTYAQMAKFTADQISMFDPDEEAIACFCGD